jgi:hypothetical protein
MNVMNINTDAVNEVALALRHQTLRTVPFVKASLERAESPFEKGFICDAIDKTQSVVLTDEGLCESERLLTQHLRDSGHPNVTNL